MAMGMHGLCNKCGCWDRTIKTAKWLLIVCYLMIGNNLKLVIWMICQSGNFEKQMNTTEWIRSCWAFFRFIMKCWRRTSWKGWMFYNAEAAMGIPNIRLKHQDFLKSSSISTVYNASWMGRGYYTDYYIWRGIWKVSWDIIYEEHGEAHRLESIQSWPRGINVLGFLLWKHYRNKDAGNVLVLVKHHCPYPCKHGFSVLITMDNIMRGAYSNKCFIKLNSHKERWIWMILATIYCNHGSLCFLEGLNIKPLVFYIAKGLKVNPYCTNFKSDTYYSNILLEAWIFEDEEYTNRICHIHKCSYMIISNISRLFEATEIYQARSCNQKMHAQDWTLFKQRLHGDKNSIDDVDLYFVTTMPPDMFNRLVTR